MPNGKPGDHRLTDALVHGLPGYSAEADALIREIARLLPLGRLKGLFDWDSPPPLSEFIRLLRAKRDELVRDAIRFGWDLSSPVPGAVPVEDVLRGLQTASKGVEQPEVWVPDRITLNGAELPEQVVAELLADKAGSLGLELEGISKGDGGTTHRYRKR